MIKLTETNTLQRTKDLTPLFGPQTLAMASEKKKKRPKVAVRGLAQRIILHQTEQDD